MATICVFCSSSDQVSSEYFDLARKLGQTIAEQGHDLVYGGTDIGLMGAVAMAAKDAGGRIIGVIPEKILELGVAYEEADELVEVHDLRERKRVMDERSDAFIALPGGLGTLEEIIEIFNLKFLRYHQKSLVFLNHKGFYDPLFAFFEKLYQEDFTTRRVQELFAAVPDVESAMEYINGYRPAAIDDSWYKIARG